MKQWRFPPAFSMFGFNLHIENYVFRCSVAASLCAERGWEGGNGAAILVSHKLLMQMGSGADRLLPVLLLDVGQGQNFTLCDTSPSAFHTSYHNEIKFVSFV
jgi:hypothetical protein